MSPSPASSPSPRRPRSQTRSISPYSIADSSRPNSRAHSPRASSRRRSSRPPSPASSKRRPKRRSKSKRRQSSSSSSSSNENSDDENYKKGAKGTMLFLGAIAAAGYAAHKWWPEGVIYSTKRPKWECEEAEHNHAGKHDKRHCAPTPGSSSKRLSTSYQSETIERSEWSRSAPSLANSEQRRPPHPDDDRRGFVNEELMRRNERPPRRERRSSPPPQERERVHIHEERISRPIQAELPRQTRGGRSIPPSRSPPRDDSLSSHDRPISRPPRIRDVSPRRSNYTLASSPPEPSKLKSFSSKSKSRSRPPPPPPPNHNPPTTPGSGAYYPVPRQATTSTYFDEAPTYVSREAPAYATAEQPMYSTTEKPVYTSRVEKIVYSTREELPVSYSTRGEEPVVYSTMEKPVYAESGRAVYTDRGEPVYAVRGKAERGGGYYR